MSASRRRRAASTNDAALDDGEALAAARATRGEHTTTAGGPHARAKPMHTRTSTGLRLIGALQGRVPSPAEQNDQKTSVCADEHSSRRGAFFLGYSSRASENGRRILRSFPSVWRRAAVSARWLWGAFCLHNVM